MLANSFEKVTREWYIKQLPTWADTTAKKRLALLENDIFPWLGALPISEIGTLEILSTLQRIENRGAKNTAHNGRQVITQAFHYARLTQRCKHDPDKDLKGALTPKKTNHRPAITEPAELGRLLIAIDDYQGLHIVPLPAQAIATLKDLEPLTGRGKYVFPSQSKRFFRPRL